MKKNLTHLIIMGISYSCIGVVLQTAILNCVLALPSGAQEIKSVKEVTIEVAFSDATLSEVFRKIESATNYRFVYYKEDISNKYRLDLGKISISVADILFILSRDNGLSFKQEDKYISVKKIVNSNVDKQEGDKALFQDKTVTGRVTSIEDNEPLIGVNVVIKGTSNGTVTDIEGRFSISIPEDAILIFSSVGYIIEEIQVGHQSVIDVAMSPNIEQLQDVVIVGYGVQKKRDVTGAVGKVTAENLKNAPVRSAGDALQGKSPGVIVTSTSGSPGSLSAVRIRGEGTVNSTDPLYVVDGLPQTGVGWLNVNDIESMEILKDASATAIYGARGANGVILISTKKGSIEDEYRSTITFDAYYGWQNAAKRYHMLNAEDFMAYKNLAYENNHQDLLSDFATPENREAILDFLEENTGSREGTDWWDEIMNKNAPIQSYNFAVSGGLQKLAYHSSLAYMNQEGIVKGSDYERISWRTNVETQLTDWFKLTSNLGLIYESRHNIDEYNPYTGTIFCALTADPITPVHRNNLTNIPDFLVSKLMTGYEASNPFSAYAPVMYSNKQNPVAQIERMSQSVWEGISLKGGMAADIRLTDYLKYRGNFGIDLHRGISKGFMPSYYLDGDEYNTDADVSRYLYNSDYFVFENTVTFDQYFGDHHVLAMVGLSAEKTESDPFGASKEGLVNNEESLRILDAASKNAGVSGAFSESSLASYFGRFFYSYMDKYMVTVNIRRDGSSNFDEGKKWGVFPSFSLGWNFNRESFLENVTWLSEGKVRFSWGEIGNHNIGGGQYLSAYSNGGYIVTGTGYSPILTAGRSQVGNPNIQWETTRQTDIGLDLELFERDFTITIDWFNKKTDDMLVQVPIPATMGYPNTPWVNAGSVKNTGWEFALTYNGAAGDFKYSIGGNLFTYKNEVLSLGGGEPINQSGHLGYYTLTRTEEGMPIGYFYGLKTDGIFQSADEIASYINDEGELLQPDARPGDLRFVDLDGNGSIDENDRTQTGNPFPDFTYGITLNAEYKGFDFTAFFQGSQGNEILNILKYDIRSGAGWYNAPNDMPDKAWHGEGTSNSQFSVNANSGDNLTMSDWYIEDGSYLRMKNIQLGYTLPSRGDGLTRSKMQSIRFWVGAQNMFTITNYSGLDPEMGSTDPKSMGIDVAFYPQARTYMLGVNARF